MGTGGPGGNGDGLGGDRCVVGALGCGVGRLSDLDGYGPVIGEGRASLHRGGQADGPGPAILGEAGLDPVGSGVGIDREGNSRSVFSFRDVVVVVGYGDLGGSGSGGAALQAVGCVQLGAAGRG